VHSKKPAITGNQLKNDMRTTHVLVALVGQVEIDESQIQITGHLVKTRDGIKVGILLSNGRVMLKI
jgi:hypothetical protein